RIMGNSMAAACGCGIDNETSRTQAILLIVVLTLVRITQRLIGGMQFDEAHGSISIRAGIRVIAFYQATISGFDLLLAGSGRDAQDMIVVDESHCDASEDGKPCMN